MLAILLAASQTATAPTQATEDTDRTIVVTATRLDATKKALDACIVRKCPPDQEVAAALAHAENQFVEGDYKAARTTLHGTIGRVDGQAKQYPVAVANIWRADARISAHLGEDRWVKSGQLQAVDALKAGLSKTDDRVLLQRLQVADAFMKQGKVDMGLAGYRKVVEQAKDLNSPGAQGTAMLRILLIEAGLAGLPTTQLNPQARYGASDANFRQAKASAAALLATTDPQLSGFRDAAKLIDARLDAQRGDMRGIDALAADYGARKQDKAILLYAPLMNDRGTFFDPARAGLLTEQDFDDQWVDVTFLIGSDGRVKEVETLRESPKLRKTWVTPVLDTVSRRRYAPIVLADDLDGMRRVERYTMTSSWTSGTTGTNIRTRSGQPRLEVLDLTADPSPKTSAARPAPTPAS
ncbi:hypothetical protein ASE86_13030 [Sphingomonas sp. Leaf33]|nr:hypothetical protein ASE86_13030 [Sphingomonas sp. Leaf33]